MKNQFPPGVRRPDVTGLVIGAIFTLFAAVALFVACGVTLRVDHLRIALPIILVLIGAAGLFMSRGRDTH